MTPSNRTPDLAVLLLLVFATLWRGLAIASLAGAQLVPETLMLGLVQGSLGLAGAVVVSARLKGAPFVVGSLALFLFLAPLFSSPGGPPAGDLGSPTPGAVGWARASITGWLVLLAAGAAWLGREHFGRSWDPGSIPGWSREGLARLRARDSGAGKRIVAGLGIMLGAFGLLVLMHLTGLGLGARRLVAALLLGGGMLFFSGLSLSES